MPGMRLRILGLAHAARSRGLPLQAGPSLHYCNVCSPSTLRLEHVFHIIPTVRERLSPCQARRIIPTSCPLASCVLPSTSRLAYVVGALAYPSSTPNLTCRNIRTSRISLGSPRALPVGSTFDLFFREEAHASRSGPSWGLGPGLLRFCCADRYAVGCLGRRRRTTTKASTPITGTPQHTASGSDVATSVTIVRLRAARDLRST